MNRLYQWLAKWASFSRPGSSAASMSRTVRTEVTVEEQGLALYVSGASSDVEHCPLCGQRLAVTLEEHPRFCLQKASTDQAHIPADDAPP